MSGIGVDQTSLLQNEEFAKQANDDEMSKDKGTNPKDINNAGGPTYGRESKVEEHKSEVLNKLDPRIGYKSDEVDASVERYEAKYGKPKEGFEKEHKDSKPELSMAGIGSDQSALFPRDDLKQDSAGHS